MTVKRLGVGLVAIAGVAWAMHMPLAVVASAHTLPMSEVRRGIRDAIADKFPGMRVVIRLQGCRRIDAHAGQCVVRAYTLPYHDRWCGVGHARAIGKSRSIRALGAVTPCPMAHGAPQGGHPITA